MKILKMKYRWPLCYLQTWFPWFWLSANRKISKNLECPAKLGLNKLILYSGVGIFQKRNPPEKSDGRLLYYINTCQVILPLFSHAETVPLSFHFHTHTPTIGSQFYFIPKIQTIYDATTREVFHFRISFFCFKN